MAIGRSLYCGFSADIPARANSVLDDEGLTESLESHCPIRRATMSFGPPAGNGEIKRTGRVG